MRTLTVLLDDQRDMGVDLILRRSEHAVATLRRLHKSIAMLYMDNDIAADQPEGRHVLDQILADSKHSGEYIPSVVIVTGNSCAADYMRQSLKAHGYRQASSSTHWKRT